MIEQANWQLCSDSVWCTSQVSNGFQFEENRKGPRTLLHFNTYAKLCFYLIVGGLILEQTMEN